MKGVCEGLGEKADFLKIPMQENERHIFYEKNFEKFLKYTAIFAVSDFYALELMHFLQKKQVNIPEDISIIGFDGSVDAKKSKPRLTTVKQDNKLRAQTAISLLIRMINDSSVAENLCIPVELEIGESVKNHIDI